MKRILTLTVALALLLGMMLPASSLAAYNMFVYTSNGKSLNVRSEPTVGDNIIQTIPFGHEVAVDYHLGNGWTALIWGSYGTAYVQTRFLSSEKPSRKPSPQPSGGSSSDNATTVSSLNTIFKTYKKVNPYTVTVRPTRSSGWVNLRFAPSKSTEVMATYNLNDQVIVIAELKDWYQVQDPVNGTVGYMSTAFVVR